MTDNNDCPDADDEWRRIEAAMANKKLARIEDEDSDIDEHIEAQVEEGIIETTGLDLENGENQCENQKIHLPPDENGQSIKTWKEAVDLFRALEIHEEKRSSFSFRFLLKPRLNFVGGNQELSLLNRISEEKYDPGNETHWCLLRTVYEAIVPGEERADPIQKIGCHWECIGFQGSDPRTDINRSMRCLALIQLLALAQDQSELCSSLYKLANTDARDWPLACTSISFTRDALLELRSGKLYPLCNRKKSVLSALNDRHQTLFKDFHSRLIAGEERFEALNRTRGRYCKTSKHAVSIKKKKKKTPYKSATLEFTSLDDPHSKKDENFASSFLQEEQSKNISKRCATYALASS